MIAGLAYYHINKVNLHRAQVVLALVTFGGTTILVFISLAINMWAGAVSTGDGFGHCWGRNDNFCGWWLYCML